MFRAQVISPPKLYVLHVRKDKERLDMESPLTICKTFVDVSSINDSCLLPSVFCFVLLFPSLVSSSSTASSNSASTSPTKSFSNSSITTCSFWNKKNTNAKESNGLSLTLAWICSKRSIWSKRYCYPSDGRMTEAAGTRGRQLQTDR